MRRIWRQQSDGSLVEVTGELVSSLLPDSGVLWNDRTYQDAGDPRFTSRQQHREYMKINGLTTVDDFRNEFRVREKERHEFATRTAPERKQDIAEAIRKLERGR